jgi:hypothetical protein
LPSDPWNRQLFLRAVPICVNLPTTLFLVFPLALISWSISRALWLLLIAIALTLAGILTFDLSREHAPRLSLILISVMLANSEILFVVGNTAGLAVSLCVIAVWCFVKARWEWFGIAGLAVSLLLKPHDSGLIWLWLLLAGNPLRKRAVQSGILAIVLAVPALLWVARAAPEWRQELGQNLAATSAHGDISDPGPDSMSRKGSADLIIDLQSVISIFHDDPRSYNPATYLICGTMLLVWITTALSQQQSSFGLWCGLASISSLSLLVVYHRPYDAKLLLLAVPACAMLADEGGITARAAAMVSVTAVVFTGDLPLACIGMLTKNLNLANLSTLSKLIAVIPTRSAPLALLLSAVFYLVAYLRRDRRERRSSTPSNERQKHSTTLA